MTLLLFSDEFYGTPSKSNEDVLICALNLFARMPNLQSVFKHEELGKTLQRVSGNKPAFFFRFKQSLLIAFFIAISVAHE